MEKGHWYTPLWPWPLLTVYVLHLLVSGIALLRPAKVTARRAASFALGALVFVGAGYEAPYRPASTLLLAVGVSVCLLLLAVSAAAFTDQRVIDKAVGLLGVFLVAGTFYLGNYVMVERFFRHWLGH